MKLIQNSPYQPSERRLLLVCSTGGHLEQLYLWAERWRSANPNVEMSWLTFDTAQSRSLLAGEQRVTFIPYIAPRDWRTLIKSIPRITRTLSRYSPERIISTGAAVAVAAFFAGYLYRTPLTYIESLARVEEFSLTAKIIHWLPGVVRLVQHPELAGSRWRYLGSVLDQFVRAPCVEEPRAVDSLRVFVTVGTIRPYTFERMLQQVDRALGPADSVVWQIGPAADFAPQHGMVFTDIGRSELAEEIRRADVVVTHAGVGSIISALTAGRAPIVFSRSARLGEHVDDHQSQIARFVESRGIAFIAESGFDRALLVEAASAKIIRTGSV